MTSETLSSSEDIRQSQLEELEVLKAIYVGDVEEYIHNNDGSTPIRFSVRILPQKGSSSGDNEGRSKQPTYIDIHFELPRDYPFRVPLLSMGEQKGLSISEVQELQSQLENLAAKNVGEVMIYQLLTDAEAYLHSHQKIQKGSFHDEMILRQKQIEEQKPSLHMQVTQIEEERTKIKEEILRKQEEIREELRRAREERRLLQVSNNSVSEDLSEGSLSASPVKGDQFPHCKRVGSKRRISAGRRVGRSNSEGSNSSISESNELMLIEFNSGKVTNLCHRGRSIGRSDRGSTVYAGMLLSGDLVAINEWKFVAKLDKKGKEVKSVGDCLNLESLEKQLNSIESEMNLLQKLEHPNIALYLGVKIFTPVDEPGVLYALIVEEFIRGATLQSYLKGTVTCDLALVRHCAKGVLEGLRFLHDNDIVHRFLRDTSIFLDTTGDIKLCDYGVERKFCELYTQWNFKNPEEDKFPPTIGRGGKKGDVYRFGVIILSLIKGDYVTNPPEIPTTLPLPLQDFLKKCITPIDHSRWTAAELLDHDFLKLPLQSLPALGCQNKEVHCFKKEEEESENSGTEESIQFFPRLSSNGHSRVESEFEVLKWLGKGGFGDVLKVRNKLDSRIYALKRIRLNPRNKQLNKKITREVKLLSQLNHENVVRYFNSWIETVFESDTECTSTESPTTNTNSVAVAVAVNKKVTNFPQVRFLQNNPLKQNSLGLLDNVEDLVPSMRNMDSEWSVSLGPTGRQDSISEESDESSDDDDLFGTSFRRIAVEDSDEVIFERDTNGHNSSSLEKSNSPAKNDLVVIGTNSDEKQQDSSSLSLSGFLRESQFMYIQMEFCEKSTLRTAIDGNLNEDLDRAWRLFREIVEGLVHIHQQGMIHRDLKPVNIFLDSHDHVKIGDFGLATSSIIPKRPDDATSFLVHEIDAAKSLDFTEESRTGQVGTALYVAPELVSTAAQKVTYNQKVDIYSLGIIFFEMFYRPPDTGMERVRFILGLRQSTIAFPKDFDGTILPQVTHITKWLLNHDHRLRPTSLELLQSDYLPPPHLEEAELRDIFSRTLRTSKTKAYKYLVASCFKQNTSPVEDAMYDMDIAPTSMSSISKNNIVRPLHFAQEVKQIIRCVFERHSAVELQAPLLLPKTELYSEIDSSVQLMCHSGSIQTLPHDLRIPFIRYVGRNGFTHLKRYAIEKVFRERKVYGTHPRELVECAFDIIDTTQGSLISDAEVLSVVFQIVHELPWLRNKNCTLRLGHTKLLEGVILHHSLDEKTYNQIKRILADVKNERDSKSQMQIHLVSLGLSENVIQMLFTLMEVEGSFPKISNILKSLMKKKGEAASAIKEGLHELEILISNLHHFGVKCNIVVAPAMAFGSHIYNGLLFQVVCDSKRRKNKMMVDVIAAGGRYDKLLQSYRASLCLDADCKDTLPYGVGISISLDKLLAGHEESEYDGRSAVDTIICSLGHHPMSKEKISLLNELLGHGICPGILDGSQTLESAEQYCKECGATSLVILKESDAHTHIRVRILEHGRFMEKIVLKTKLIDTILKAKDPKNPSDKSDASGLNSSGSSCSVQHRSDSITVGKSLCSETNCTVIAPHPQHTSVTSTIPPYNISILVQERDRMAGIKRRYENQMMSRLQEILVKLNRQQPVEVLGLELNSTVINNLAASISNQDSKEVFSKGVHDLIEKHSRLKKYLKSICEELYDLIFDKQITVIIIYGLVDNSCRVIL